MANSIFKVHEMVNKIGWDVEDVDIKKVIAIAEKAGDLMSKGLVKEAGVAFDELGEMFNKKLLEMGKKSIDFTDLIKMPDEHTLDKMTSSFTDVIASNISDGIVAGINDGINKTIDYQAEIQKKKKELEKTQKAYKRWDKAQTYVGYEIDEFPQLKKQKDVNKQADDILNTFDTSFEKLQTLTDKSKEYIPTLLKTIEAYVDVMKMASTINADPSGFDEGVKSAFSEKALRATTQPFLDKYRKPITTVPDARMDILDRRQAELQQEIAQLEEEARLAGQELNKIAKATSDEVDKAISKRYQKDKKRPIHQKEINQAEAAIQGKLGSGDTLPKIEKEYDDAEDFVDKYKALLRFTKLYEKMQSDGHNVDKYSERYQELSQYIDIATASLEDFIHKANEVNSGNVARDTIESAKSDVSSPQHSNSSNENIVDKSDRGTQTESEAVDDYLKARDDISKRLQEANALLEKEKLTYEDILSLVKIYNNETDLKVAQNANDWDTYDKIFAQHTDIARKLVPIGMSGMGNDSPDKWLATVGISAEDAAQKLKDLYDRLHVISTVQEELVDTSQSDSGSFEEVKIGASEANEAVDNLKDSIKETQELAQDVTSDTTSDEDEFKAIQAEADALKQKNDELIERNESLQNDLDVQNNYTSQAEHERDQAQAELDAQRKENERLKSELAKEQISPSGKVDGSITDTTIEETRMKELKEAVEAVTTAVTAKTQAFKDEKNEVDGVVTSEVSSLERLKNKVVEIKEKFETLLSDINTKQPAIHAPELNEQAFVAEGDAAEKAIAKENQALQTLMHNLELTTKGINSKTAAFYSEGQIVGQVVGKEISGIIKLGQYVGDVNKQVLDLLTNLQNVKTAGQNIPKPQPTPQNNNQNSPSGGGGGKNTKLDYSASNKLREQSILKLRAELLTTGKLTKSLTKGLDYLYQNASQIADRASLDNWNRILKEIQGSVKITGIFDKADRLDEEGKYKNLVALKQLEYELQKKIINVKGTNEEKVLQKQLQQTQTLISLQSQLTNGSEQYVKLQQKEAEWVRNIEQLQASKKDAQEAQSKKDQQKQTSKELKEQEGIIKKLLPLYRQLGEARVKQSVASSADEKILATAEAKRIRELIRDERTSLVSSKDVEDKFLQATKSGADKQRTNEVNKLVSQYARLGKLQAQADHKGTRQAQEKVNKLQAEISAKTTSLHLTQTELATLKKITTEHKKAEESLLSADAADKTLKQAIKEKQKQARLGKSNGALMKGADIRTQLQNTSGISDEVRLNAITELDKKLNRLKKTYDALSKSPGPISGKQIANIQTQTFEVDNLTAQMSELLKEHNRLSADNVTPLMGTGGYIPQNIDEYRAKLIQIAQAAYGSQVKIGNFNAATKTLEVTTRTGTREFTNFTIAVDRLGEKFVSVQGQTKKTEGFIAASLRKIKEIGTYFSGSSVIYKAWNSFLKGIQYIKDIDSALTELRKVTDETEESYERFLNTASKTANKVGSTIKEIVNSTADWSRLGYSMEQAAKLAESTSVLLNVSEFQSIDDATSALTSTLQAFGYAAEDSMHVVDVMNIVGKYIAQVV